MRGRGVMRAGGVKRGGGVVHLMSYSRLSFYTAY